LCGISRPGHFRGVATVVVKLFQIVQPDRSYFGQKDYQQTVVIRKMVRDLNVPTEVIVCPTVREPDGLAMSSRNTYLSAEGRARARSLVRALRKGEAALHAGERNPEVLVALMKAVLSEEPDIAVDYVAVVDAEDLKKTPEFSDKDKVLLALAAKIGGVRLIDNLVVDV